MKITYTDVKPFVDSLKEGGRVIALAVVSFLLSSVVINNLVNQIFGSFLPGEIMEAMVAAIFIVLRVVDKYLHLTGEVNKDEALKKGLTQF